MRTYKLIIGTHREFSTVQIIYLIPEGKPSRLDSMDRNLRERYDWVETTIKYPKNMGRPKVYGHRIIPLP